MDDAISLALLASRVTGQVLLQETYGCPWSLEIPGSKDLAGLLGLRRAVAFHFARRGSFELAWVDGTIVVPEAHVAIGFGGEAHRMGNGLASKVHLSDHLDGESVGVPDGERTQVVCGAFALEGVELSPFIQALPAFLCAPLDPRVMAHLFREMDGGQLGSGFAVSRLLELMCLDAVRVHAASSHPGGWFATASDRVLSRAMAAMHSDPGAPWTVPELARVAGLSTSRFATRFREVLGEPPMQYVTRLRMHEAGCLLSRSDLRISEVSSRVGYLSTSAFSRVFHRHAKMSPRDWRTTHAGP